MLINVFDWADDWTIEVTDLSDDSSLAVQRVRTHDPVHVISYNMRKLDKKSEMCIRDRFDPAKIEGFARRLSELQASADHGKVIAVYGYGCLVERLRPLYDRKCYCDVTPKESILRIRRGEYANLEMCIRDRNSTCL